jgi:hypothetical protein
MFFSTASLLVKPNGGPQQSLRVAGTATGQWLESPALRTIVSHEELLQLGHRSGRRHPTGEDKPSFSKALIAPTIEFKVSSF